MAQIEITRGCVSCGEDFTIEIDPESRQIVTNCYYGGKFRLGIGMWASRKLVYNPDGSHEWVKVHPWYRVLWFRLKDLWKLLIHDYVEAEFWECGGCLNKEFPKDEDVKIVRDLTDRVLERSDTR